MSSENDRNLRFERVRACGSHINILAVRSGPSKARQSRNLKEYADPNFTSHIGTNREHLQTA